MAEEIYQNLTNEESVNLSDWPIAKSELINEDLEENMRLARELASVILM